jgi:hypothetical protein
MAVSVERQAARRDMLAATLKAIVMFVMISVMVVECCRTPTGFDRHTDFPRDTHLRIRRWGNSHIELLETKDYRKVSSWLLMRFLFVRMAYLRTGLRVKTKAGPRFLGHKESVY